MKVHSSDQSSNRSLLIVIGLSIGLVLFGLYVRFGSSGSLAGDVSAGTDYETAAE